MTDVISFLLLLSIFSGTKEARLPFLLVIYHWVTTPLSVKSLHFRFWTDFSLFICSCTDLLCSLGSCSARNVHEVRRSVWDVFKPWWRDSSRTSLCCAAPKTQRQRCQLHVLLLAISNNVQKSDFLQTWLLVVIGFQNFHLRIFLGLKATKLKACYVFFFCDFSLAMLPFGDWNMFLPP